MEAKVRYRILTKNVLFKKNAVDEIYSYEKDFTVIEGIKRAVP